MATTSVGDNRLEKVLADCVAALRQLATSRLPPALDRRLLWLSENKDSLSAAEREELLATIEFAEDRTVEKLRAKALLKELADLCPHLVSAQP
jgi:hypothetical protein